MKSARTASARRRPRPLKPVGAATVIEEQRGLDDRNAPIVERPDGFHWVAADGRREFGPFATYEEARADRDGFGETGAAPVQALLEAETDLGIADWIDPDTGSPAEGPSAPHFNDD